MQRKMNGSMGEKINIVKNLDPTPKRNLVWRRWIPPRREIWSGSDGAHPEEKSNQGATDLTPKENQGGR